MQIQRSGVTADLIVQASNGKIIKYEFKSWTTGTNQPWNGFFAGNNGSYQQFLNYLGASDELSEIKYIFNGNKATITDVKNAFKDLFLAKGNEIFSRMNPSFRENLLGLGNENRFDIFQQKINDLGSNLYEFIKLQGN